MAVIFSSGVFQVRNNQGPYSHNIGHDVNDVGHHKAAADDGVLQCWTRSHPVTTLHRLQPVHHELCHGVPVHNSKNIEAVH